MDIRKQLLKEHSRKNAEVIAELVLQDKERLKTLFDILKEGEYRPVQRVAWVLGIVCEKRPEWIAPFLPLVISHIEYPLHPAVSRNLYRILQDQDIPEEYMGDLYSLSIRDLSDPKTPIAVKAFCMTVAWRITMKYPELKSELKLILEEQLPYSSAGFQSRARKIIPRL